MSRPGRKLANGFTLLELVLVMLIACTALALAAPSMRGWSRGARLRNSAEEFLNMTRLARTQAVTRATIYRIQIDTQAGTFKLLAQQGSEFVEVNDELARMKSVPEGGQIELTRPQADSKSGNSSSETAVLATDAIDFYPNGRTQAAHVRISDDSKHSFDIECASPAERFQIVTQTESSS
jgi:type II secretion system protein H